MAGSRPPLSHIRLWLKPDLQVHASEQPLQVNELLLHTPLDNFLRTLSQPNPRFCEVEYR